MKTLIILVTILTVIMDYKLYIRYLELKKKYNNCSYKIKLSDVYDSYEDPIDAWLVAFVGVQFLLILGTIISLFIIFLP